MGEFERDRWGRPKVIVPGQDKLVSYKRPSGYGEVLDDKYSMNIWKQRMAIVGAAKRPDLLLQVAALSAHESAPNVTADELKTIRNDLNRLIEDCQEAAGASEGRRLGDALHKYIALVNAGHTEVAVLPPWDRDIAAYRKLLADHGLRAVPSLIERSVINDEFEAAGSFDLALEEIDTGHIFLGDAKTGQRLYLPSNAYLVQAYLYATSQLYNTETGERTPFPDGWRTDKAFIVHVPAGQGRAELVAMDLVEGRERTILARQVVRVMKDESPFRTLPTPSATTDAPVAAAAVPVVADTLVDDDLPGRMAGILALEKGKRVLGEAWMEAGVGFPPKRLAELVEKGRHPSSTPDTHAQLAAARKVIERAEMLLDMPFMDPPIPTPAPLALVPEPVTVDFEGPDVDAGDVKALAKSVKELDSQAQEIIKGFAAAANKAKGSISLRQHPSLRRFEIGRALVTVCQGFTWPRDTNEEAAGITYTTVGALLDLALGESDDAPGKRLAHLNYLDAARFALAADQLAADQLTTRVADDGHLSFADIGA